jgi:ABC-2 type transport system permease protein
MRILLRVISVQLNINFGISALKYRFAREKKKLLGPAVIGIFILWGLGTLLFVYSMFLLAMFSSAVALGQPEMVLVASFTAGQLFVLAFGLLYIMGSLYYSTDMGILVPLPLKPYQVLGGKFAVVMVNEYLTLLPILLPAVIIYGTGTGQGFFYWVKGLFVILLSPVFPLVIDSLFIMLLMRFINLRKRKDMLAVVGGLLGIVFALGINFFINRFFSGNQQEYINNFLSGRINLAEEIGRRFPPAAWASSAIAEPGLKGLGYLLLFAAVSAVLFLVLMRLGNLLFYKSLLAGQEVTQKRRLSVSGRRRTGHVRARSPIMAVFIKEWKLLMRTPVYMINGLTGSLIGPFILVFVMLSQRNADEFNKFFLILRAPGYSIYVTLGALALMLFTAGMNTVPSTAVSREGSTFWISKAVPVTAREQAAGKLLQSLSVSALGVLTSGMVLLIFLQLPVINVVLSTILGLMGSAVLSALGLMTDVFKPKLDWSTPQQAMKQNINALLGMLETIVFMLLLGAVSAVLLIMGTPYLLLLAILCIVILVLMYLSITLLFKAAEKSYNKIEA